MVFALRVGVFLVLLGALASCSGGERRVQPTDAGGSRGDGIVHLTSVTKLLEPSQPDWSLADDTVQKRCRSWGFKAPHQFTGSRESCRAWDMHGRCTELATTRYFACSG